MKNLLFIKVILLLLISVYSSCGSSQENIEDNSINEKNKSSLYPKDLMYFSQDFYLAVRYEDPINAYLDTLSKIDANLLEKDLNTHNKSLSFWINIYNALVQVKIINDKGSFENQQQFFKNKDLVVAGLNVSLDEIEHGILRLKEYNNELVKRFMLDSIDYRIHFTMNCGATSCPAIAYYKPETIQGDLKVAEKLFIKQNSTYDSFSNTLEISELIKWFKDDFGGDKGIYKLMINNGIIQEDIKPIIKYKPYNWELKSKNYQ